MTLKRFAEIIVVVRDSAKQVGGVETLLRSISALEELNTEAPGKNRDKTKPLRIGYSDWPGWLVLEIGKQKGFFKDVGAEMWN